MGCRVLRFDVEATGIVCVDRGSVAWHIRWQRVLVRHRAGRSFMQVAQSMLPGVEEDARGRAPGEGLALAGVVRLCDGLSGTVVLWSAESSKDLRKIFVHP